MRIEPFLPATQGLQVQLRWRSRRFFCDTPICPRRIFTERLPQLTSPYASKTSRPEQTLLAAGLSCGGGAGSRLAARLGMAASPDTLLRVLRRTAIPPPSGPQVLGVDEWAFRRGQRYGTILCDLERRRVVDLLPDRSSESFAAWLAAHPQVEITSRDRADCYAQGAAAAAPQAAQVADRWHLLKNARDAPARVADRYPQQLIAAAQAAASESEPEESVLSTDACEAPIAQEKATGGEELKQIRRTKRLERYERAQRLYPRRTDPFVEYLRQPGEGHRPGMCGVGNGRDPVA